MTEQSLPGALAPTDLEHAALLEVGAALGATLDLEQVLDVIVDRCRALVGAGAAGILRLDPDTGQLSYERGVGFSPEFTRLLTVRVGEGTTGLALAERQPVWSANLLTDPSLTLTEATRELVRREGYRAVLSVPILSHGEGHGVLAAYWWEPREPGAREVALLTALAGQAGAALHNARLYAAAEARGKRLQMLARLTERLTASLAVEEVLDRVVQSATELSPTGAAGVWLLDETGQSLALRAHVGIRSEPSGAPFPVGEGLPGEVAARRAPVLVADIRHDSRIRVHQREVVAAEGFISFAGVPLVVAERLIGVLGVASRQAPAFTGEDLALIQSLANHAAVAIDNARLYRDAARQAEQMRVVAELGRSLVSTFEVDRILQMVTTRARETLGISQVGICLEEPDSGRLRFVHGGSPNENLVWGHDWEPWEGVVGRAMIEGRALWSSDTLTDPTLRFRPETLARLSSATTRAVLALPLAGGRTFGALVVVRETGSRFDEAEIEYLSVFASQVAVAVQNARLYAETRRRLEETRALLEVEEILNSTLAPRPRLKAVAMKIAQVCRVDRCSIERWDGDRVQPLMAQFADGRRDERQWAAFTGGKPHAPRDVPAYARVLETRRPVVIPDARASDDLPREWVETYGHRAYLLVPLVRQDAIIGAMALDQLDRPGPFETWQVELATAIAGQLVLSIENMRLYAEVQERLRETTTLLAVGQAMSQPLDSTEVMRQVAREVARAFKADMAAVYVMDERREGLKPVAGYHVPKALHRALVSRPLPLERSPWLRDALRKGHASWSGDLVNELGVDRAAFGELGAASVLLAPTRVRGEPMGALVLTWWGAGRSFEPAEVRLAEGVAAHVGLAVEVADLARQGQQKRQETETLQSVSRMLASTLDPETLPRLLVRHVVRALGGDTGGLWLVDDTGECLRPHVGYRAPKIDLDAFRRIQIPIGSSAWHAEAFRTRRPARSPDIREDPRTPECLRHLGTHRTQLFVPVVAQDRAVGILTVMWREGDHDVSEGDVRLVEMVASQAGVALENVRLFAENQRRVEELSVLHQLARALTGQLDRGGLVDTLPPYVARILDVRYLVVLLLDESGQRLDVLLRVRDGVRSDGEPRSYPRREAGLSGVVLERGQLIRTDDYAAECRRHGVRGVPQSDGLPFWLGAPMIAGDRTLGVVALRSPDRPFTARDDRLLSSVADLLALSLKGAELFAERARAYAELAAAQDQLVRTEKLRAMGEMASGVAHDFNNVLASILGRAQLLRGKVEDAGLARWIEVIERSAMDGARTVKRLQEFTRIRRDQPDVEVDLNQVLQETLEATEPSWRDEPRRRGVEIDTRLSLAPALPRISGDPAALRDAMTNLILNAVDAMPAGGRLSLGSEARGNRVEVTVRDTGVGIPASIRARIFDPFFTTKGPRGTGLGLSMAYGILARHRARIAVESEEGKGTTFRVEFPVPAVSPAVAAGEPPPAPAQGLRCLVVDDEEAVAEVLGDMLASAGHRADVVNSGAEALARFRAGGFDVVFTDLAMPGMSGWDVARAVKAAPASAPVVMITGFGVEVSPEELRDNGVDLVVTKPLRVVDIQRALAAVRPDRAGDGGRRA